MVNFCPVCKPSKIPRRFSRVGLLANLLVSVRNEYARGPSWYKRLNERWITSSMEKPGLRLGPMADTWLRAELTPGRRGSLSTQVEEWEICEKHRPLRRYPEQLRTRESALRSGSRPK